MEIQYGNTNYFYLLVLAALLLVLSIVATIGKRVAMRRFASSNLVGNLGTTSRLWRQLCSSILVVIALSLLALALVDVRWGREEQEVPQRGIEVIFVLDVSRSMLAQDATPSRLERAKQQITDLIDEMSGDRVGLVLFAGEARQVVPLTSHYDDFIQTLATVSPDSVRVGGSKLGDAIRTAANSFITKTNEHKTMVIFTDGEDQESDPVEAARNAVADKRIRIFTIGLGDMDQGARVPAERPDGRRQFLDFKGETVWSKLNGQVLNQIANETGGAYIPAGTKQVNMSDVYQAYISTVEQTEFGLAKVNAYIPRFQLFALPALILLLIEVMWATSQPKNSAAGISPQSKTTTHSASEPLHRKAV